jgi:hypothetical protein
MSLLSLLEEIHHMRLSLVAKNIDFKSEILICSFVISGKWIISYSTSIIIDIWMVEIHSCRFFYLRTSSWSQPMWLFNNHFELLLSLRPSCLLSIKTQIVSSLLTSQVLEVIAHMSRGDCSYEWVNLSLSTYFNKLYYTILNIIHKTNNE